MPPNEGDTDTISVVVDEDGQDAETQAQESSPEAVRVASLMGWKPADQWKGDKSGWKSAEDFLAEVPEIMRSTRKTNQRLEGQMARIVGQVAKLQSGTDRQTSAALERAMEAAVEKGDLDEAKKILANAKSSAQPDEHPSFTSFKARNDDWWDVDDDATAFAAALDRRLAKDGIPDPDAHFKKIEAGVKKRFPELFGEAKDSKVDDDDAKPAKDTPRAPLVARGGRGAARTSNGVITEADLSSQQLAAAKQFGVTPKAYAKSLNEITQKERRA